MNFTKISDRILFDMHLKIKEEIEIRSAQRTKSVAKLNDTMLIEKAKNEVGLEDYNKYIREGIIYEVGDRVRLLR